EWSAPTRAAGSEGPHRRGRARTRCGGAGWAPAGAGRSRAFSGRQDLLAPAGKNPDRSHREAVETDAGPSGVHGHRGQLFRRPVGVDRVAEIAVRGRRPRKQAADRREESLQIQPVRGTDDTPRRAHEFEHHRSPPRDAHHLAQAEDWVGQIAQAERDRCRVEACILKRKLQRVALAQIFCQIDAMPWPTPMHMVARPYSASRWPISRTSVLTSRAPLLPSGWPSAIAPPLTFTFSSSMPSSRMHASDWDAKASFSSTTPMSAGCRPAFSSAFRVEGTGPIPM